MWELGAFEIAQTRTGTCRRFTRGVAAALGMQGSRVPSRQEGLRDPSDDDAPQSFCKRDGLPPSPQKRPQPVVPSWHCRPMLWPCKTSRDWLKKIKMQLTADPCFALLLLEAD